jgi:hypothetical protein
MAQLNVGSDSNTEKPPKLSGLGTFVGREDEIVKLKDAAMLNRFNRMMSNPDAHDAIFVRVTSLSRMGKTRLAQHAQQIVDELEPEEKDGRQSEAVYACVDFNNGLGFNNLWDKPETAATHRVGIRLAVALGLVDKNTALSLSPTWSVDDVLLAFAKKHPVADNGVVGIVIHFDEYQMYCRQYMSTHSKVSSDAARDAFKGMLKCVLECMRKPVTGTDRLAAFRKSFFLLPICSGTAPGDLTVDMTEGGVVDISLSPLSESNAMKMVCNALLQKYGDSTDFSGVLSQTHFRITLSDTLFVPGMVEFMLLNLPAEFNCLSRHDWGFNLDHRMSRYYATYGSISDEHKRMILHRLFAGLPVDRMTVVVTSDTRVTFGDLERSGAMMLYKETTSVFSPMKQPSTGTTATTTAAAAAATTTSTDTTTSTGRHRVLLPLPSLRLINGLLSPSIIPASLIRSISCTSPWQWHEFEQLHQHIQKARLNALALLLGDSVATSLQSVVPGAHLGDDLVNLNVLTSASPLTAYTEAKQFLHSKAGKVVDCIEIQVNEVEGDVPISNAVFLATTGNALFDNRWFMRIEAEKKRMFGFNRSASKKTIQILSQNKFSAPTTANATIKSSDIKSWYKDGVASLSKSKHEHALCLFTNRSCYFDDGNLTQLLKSCPRLILITANEMSEYLTPTFANRGLLVVRPVESECESKTESE